MLPHWKKSGRKEVLEGEISKSNKKKNTLEVAENQMVLYHDMVTVRQTPRNSRDELRKIAK